MPAAGPPLAGGAAAGQTSPGRRGQSPARPGRAASAVSGPSPRPRPLRHPEVTPARGHAAETFFPFPYAIGRAATNTPVTSLRNPARYCCPACRQAVRNVQDRERKWLSRGTLDGRKKRGYRVPSRTPAPVPAARQHLRPDAVAATSGVTIPPGRAGRQLSRGSWRLI